jgi:hypothetical protein
MPSGVEIRQPIPFRRTEESLLALAAPADMGLAIQKLTINAPSFSYSPNRGSRFAAPMHRAIGWTAWRSG